MTIFWVKSTISTDYNSLSIVSHFFQYLTFQNKIYGYKKGKAGSGTDKNQDMRSGINIPDPQHCI